MKNHALYYEQDRGQKLHLWTEKHIQLKPNGIFRDESETKLKKEKNIKENKEHNLKISSNLAKQKLMKHVSEKLEDRDVALKKENDYR